MHWNAVIGCSLHWHFSCYENEENLIQIIQLLTYLHTSHTSHWHFPIILMAYYIVYINSCWHLTIAEEKKRYRASTKMKKKRNYWVGNKKKNDPNSFLQSFLFVAHSECDHIHTQAYQNCISKVCQGSPIKASFPFTTFIAYRNQIITNTQYNWNKQRETNFYDSFFSAWHCSFQ